MRTPVGQAGGQAAHLGVVGGHDHDVLGPERARAAVCFGDGSALEIVDGGADQLGLLDRLAGVAGVLGLDEAHPGAGERPGRIDVLACAGLDRVQAALVDDLGDEAADVGVHASGAVEEDSKLWRDRAVLSEQVLEHRGAGSVRMDALGDLRELKRVSEEDQVARGGAHRQGVGERDLPCLVDHEMVQGCRPCLVGECSHAVPATRRTSSGGGKACTSGSFSMNERASFETNCDSGLSLEHFFQPRKPTCCSVGGFLDLVQQVVDRLVAGRRHADSGPPRDEVDDELRAGPRLA